MDYKEKYLKYKFKYLNLKGSGFRVNDIVFVNGGISRNADKPVGFDGDYYFTAIDEKARIISIDKPSMTNESGKELEFIIYTVKFENERFGIQKVEENKISKSSKLRLPRPINEIKILMKEWVRGKRLTADDFLTNKMQLEKIFKKILNNGRDIDININVLFAGISTFIIDIIIKDFCTWTVKPKFSIRDGSAENLSIFPDNMCRLDDKKYNKIIRVLSRWFYDVYYNKYPFAKTDAVDFESLDNKYLKED
jgi:hypothetical protein